MIREQLEQAKSANFNDTLLFPDTIDSETQIEGLNYVGGLDISFRENGEGAEGIATLAVLSFPHFEVSYKATTAL